MRKHLSSASSAKDKPTLHDLDDLDLAKKAEARFAKREQIMQPQPKLRPTTFGKIVIGLLIGVALTIIVVLVERATTLFISELVGLYLILVIIILGRQQKKLKDQAKGRRQ
jgi:capsular polysaccharide biosynthesis protein